MHIEVQVALNFVISYLYNKLPRRRVNIFGEELEKALKEKFQGHWYPEKPFKGSAFRCLKTGDPIDKVLEKAARESGVPIQDILENLPTELAVWVDPGEVSYRIGEKGQVKVLFSDKIDSPDDHSADREVTKTFNPEAQCFRPIESVGCSLGNLSLSPKQQGFSQQQQQQQQQQQHQQVGLVQQVQQQQQGLVQQITSAQQHLLQQAAAQAAGIPTPALIQLATAQQQQQQQISNNSQQPAINMVPISQQQQQQSQHHLQQQVSVVNGVGSGAPSPTGGAGQAVGNFKGSPSPVPPSFIPRTTTPLTFTTATFAQTKFGSTKLKTNSKRANRMSPTEFSNYIKQRAAMQQQMHQPPPPPSQSHSHHSPGSSQNGRPLSPDSNSVAAAAAAAYYYPPHGPYAAAAAAISVASHQYPPPQRGGLQPFDSQTNSSSSNSNQYLSADNIYSPNKLSTNNSYDQQHLGAQLVAAQPQANHQQGTQYYSTAANHQASSNNVHHQQQSNSVTVVGATSSSSSSSSSSVGQVGSNNATNGAGNNGQDNGKLMDNWPYPGTNAGQYQHLLVAN